MNKKLKIIVTGGSGFIGSNLMSFLISREIECLNIDFKPPKIKSHDNYWRNIDIRDYTKLENEINRFNPTHIMHLAAATGMDVADISFFNANTDGVRNIIEASKKSTSVEKVLFTSSLLVCENGYIPLDNDDYCPPNLYGKSKMIGEQIVKENDQASFDWTIVRPTSVWGPWCEGGYTAFFQTIKKGYYMHPGSEEIIKPITFVGNTVFMMYKILLSDKSNRDTFYLCDYPEASTRKWASTIQESLGSARIRTVPIILLKVVALFFDLLKLLGYREPPISSFRLKNMLTGGNYPINNTQDVCKNLPNSLNESVDLTIDWLTDQDLLR